MGDFEYLEIPCDEDDHRYCRSFTAEESDSKAVQEFFDQYGFCIFRNVISGDMCRDTVDDMWRLVEECNPGVSRLDPETWSRGWSSFGMPKNTKSQALFRPSLLRLRQHPDVVKCFAGILQSDDIVCNHDRWLMHRPTMVNGVYRSDWATKPNVHLDMNPAEYFDDSCKGDAEGRLGSLQYGIRKNRAFISENNDVHYSMGRVVQSILNLSDLPSTRDGGGTIVVPRTHSALADWARKELERGKLGSVVGPTQHHFGPEVLGMAQRVHMRPGSLLMWDQRLIHGSNINRSRKFRCGIPIRFFHSEMLRQQRGRATDRARTINSFVKAEGFENELTELGRKVFGFDVAGIVS